METSLPGNNNGTSHQAARLAARETLRRNVVEVASHVLTTEGPAALTVRRIAEALDCSTKVIYSMFGGKDGLATELYLEGVTRLRHTIEQVAPTADPESYLIAVGQAYRSYALAHPAYYAVMFGGAIPDFQPDADARSRLDATMAVVVTRLADYIDQGSLPATDPLWIAKPLWAALHGVVSLTFLEHFPDAAFAEQVFDVTLRTMIRGLTQS